MAAQQENRDVAGGVNGDSIVAEPKIQVGTASMVHSSSMNQMRMEGAPDLDHNDSIGHLAASADYTASASASESHNRPHQAEQKEVAVSTRETSENPAIRISVEEASISEPYPPEIKHHPIEEASLDDLISTPQVPLEQTVKTSTTMADVEPKLDAHLLNQASHTACLQSTMQSSLDESSQSGKGSNYGEPNVDTSTAPVPPRGDPQNPHHASPTSQAPIVAAIEPEQIKDFNDIEKSLSVVDDAPQFRSLKSLSLEASKILANADTSMDEMGPMREALPNSEASVAEDPAAANANAAINSAAAEMDHVMEQHHLNVNFEIDRSSGKTEPDLVTQADPEFEMGSRGTPQQHDRAAPASMNDFPFASDPAPTVQEIPLHRTGLNAHQPIGNEASRISPPLDRPRLEIHDLTDDQVSHVTHQPLGVHRQTEDQAHQPTNPPLNVHEPTASPSGVESSAFHGPPVVPVPSDVSEPIALYTGIGTPVDSVPADAEMDDGSSVSTIQAYLGAHAPSLGTGSVNGDFDDAHMDDGDSALGDDVESYV